MNLSQLEQQFSQARAFALAQKNKFEARAEAEGRALGPAEQASISEAIREATALRTRIERAQGDASLTAAIESMTGGMATMPGPRRGGGSIGQRLLDSECGRWLVANRGRFPAGAWTSPSSELHAATLTEDSASGGALVIPDHQSIIVPTATRPLVMADLIAPGTTDSNVISYMRETAFTNAADTVAEAAAKPESTLTFEATSDPVRKIATWIPVTEEMLEDVPASRSFLDAPMSLGVQLAEDQQLIDGSIVAPDIVGFLNRTGLAAAIARGTDTNADAVLRQIAAIFNATSLQPTGIVMNPTNWLSIQLLKSTTGEYISGRGPFTAPQQPTLWGLPVALTPAIAAGTALVGAFRTAAQIFRKGGLRVEASNSHASFFITNLVAIRAEERLALAVYRPAAFGTVTGLN